MIGVGILSFNRPHAISRLVQRICLYTDLDEVKVVISDDASTNPAMAGIYDQIDRRIVVLRNKNRAGVAGNSNRCLAELDGCQYYILLNDDVVVLRRGWQDFYVQAMQATGYHHFCYRQIGVYGARPGTMKMVKGVALRHIDDKPHGAVLAFSDLAFKTVGYFDRSFGLYGVEHVDWSTRVYTGGLQPPGFYDVVGSCEYFKIYAEPSAMESRVEHLREARRRYASSQRPVYVPYQ